MKPRESTIQYFVGEELLEFIYTSMVVGGAGNELPTGSCTAFATDFMCELSIHMIFEHKLLAITANCGVLATLNFKYIPYNGYFKMVTNFVSSDVLKIQNSCVIM